MDYRQIFLQAKKILKPDSASKRLLFILLIFFICCCFKLCAADMSPAQAQVAREKFVAEAKKYVGSPYVLGAVGPDTFDCSGLVYYVAQTALEIQLPRTSRALYNYCRIVPDSKREIGDLVFFKTNNSAPVTHVGIYIGNGQFISAISDGPNSGVIISSLNQPYWKPKYVGTGQFLRGGNAPADEPASSSDSKDDDIASGNAEPVGFLEGLVFDSTLFCDWSVISPTQFMLQFRGVDLQANARCSQWPLQPGLGIVLRYNHGMGIFQIPVIFTATMNDYVRLYVGPVLTFGTAKMPGTGEKIRPSVFPGILGVSFSTPPLDIANAKVQAVQDISYTVYNNPDNSALSFGRSIAVGLVFYSGVRVTMGMKSFL